MPITGIRGKHSEIFYFIKNSGNSSKGSEIISDIRKRIATYYLVVKEYNYILLEDPQMSPL